MMMGYAYQKGLLPLTAASIEQAIEINGVAIKMNTQAFRLGRCDSEWFAEWPAIRRAPMRNHKVATRAVSLCAKPCSCRGFSGFCCRLSFFTASKSGLDDCLHLHI